MKHEKKIVFFAENKSTTEGVVSCPQLKCFFPPENIIFFVESSETQECYNKKTAWYLHM